MIIRRCCDQVSLMAGEARWRRMAARAGFHGTLKVRGFSKTKWTPGLRVTMGRMSAGGRVITVYVSHGCGEMAFAHPRTYSPLATFGHELGHFILKQRGRGEYGTLGVFSNNTEQGRDPVERACDRYSRLLRKNTSGRRDQ